MRRPRSARWGNRKRQPEGSEEYAETKPETTVRPVNRAGGETLAGPLILPVEPSDRIFSSRQNP